MEILRHHLKLSRAPCVWPCAWVMNSITLSALFLLLTNCLAAGTQEVVIDEYQVKAAFLYNFAKFVTWPPESFTGLTGPLDICIFGPAPFGHWLQDTVNGRVVEGHTLAVHHISSVGDAASCHILFISSAEETRLLYALVEIKKTGILTVGESDSAGEAGVMINLRLEGDKLRFDINNGAAARGKLQISSKLLSLARVVRK